MFKSFKEFFSAKYKIKRPLVLFFMIFAFIFTGVNCFAGGVQDKSEEKPAAEEKTEKQGSTPVDRVGALIHDGKIEEAKTLFVSGIAPNALNAEGKNVLHFAAAEKNADLADFFIRLGTPVDTPDISGNTPLNISANLGDDQTVKILVKNGASIHHNSISGTTPAQTAITLNNSRLLESMLTQDSIASKDSDGRTVFHIAAEMGNPNAIRSICRLSGDSTLENTINEKDNAQKTALDIAFEHRISRSHAETAALLIESGADSSDTYFQYFAPAVRTLNYNYHASNGNSPLHFAVREHYSGFTYYLLDKGADPNVKNTSGATPLHEAARVGDMETLRLLISRGAKVDMQDGQGNTAMHIAIPVEVHNEAIQLLLSSGASPNLRDERGDSPAHIVIGLNREPEVLETLLSGKADVTIHNIDGKTPLFIAIEQNRINLIPLLLEYKSDIFAVTNEGKTPFEQALTENNAAMENLITTETVVQSDNGGNTPLLVAVKQGANVDIIRRILDKKASVNARNQEGDTALHITVRKNEAATGELLLSRGADIFAQNAKGESPLSLTFYSDGGIRAWMFIPVVLNARDGLGNTMLHYVTQWKLDESIPLICEKGASLEAANVTGETPLFIAVRIDSDSTVRALLNAGASVQGRDTLGNTALHAAVSWNAVAAAEALLISNIDVNAYNLYGKTSLHDAVRIGRFAIENLLVERGANLEYRDSNGGTALTEAVLIGSFRSADHLVRAGSDVNTRNNSGETPLLISVETERSDLVGLLLDHGAQIHAKNADGESPFTVALKTSSRMMLSLVEKGRDQTDDEGRSPLHIAIINNVPESEIEKIALWVGKNNVVDRAGRTSLRYAVDRKNWDAAKFLTNAGDNVFSTARDGKTPADITLLSGEVGAVRSVFGGKAINSRDSGGNNVLHYAARLSSAQIVSVLLELGADRYQKNTAGDTAAALAERWGRPEIAALLR
ncbi:hypothetical protein FACS1894190_10130 [Spirochaetia bacterium]|nr:hypothetical protein FACS1894190_10130 [Spirochaetia bacterium]